MIYSAPRATVWYFPRLVYPFTFRGPGQRERSFYTYDGDDRVSVVAHLKELGYDPDDVLKLETRPPCIFCGKTLEEHPEGVFGETCRPKCMAHLMPNVSRCHKDTCVQALVGGFMPMCLDHFFGDKYMLQVHMR